MADDSYAQEVLDNYPRLIVENYCIIASTALLWFDFSLTFTTEVRRIWRRRFTGATLVYLFTRYVALIERVFFVALVLLWNSSDRTCGGLGHTDDVLTALNYFAFSAFTVLRVYGVLGRNWKPLLVVVPLTLVKPALLIAEVSSYTPFQGGAPWGCLYSYHLPDQTLAKFSTIAKATTIASDALLIAFTWFKTFRLSKESTRLGVRAPLATLLLRDGTAYFLILLIIQIITIVSSQIGSSLTVWLVWPYFDQVLTVIFLSRFLLNLRGLYFADRCYGAGTDAYGDGDTTVGMSDIRFSTSNVVGNLGATLSFSSSDYSSDGDVDATLGAGETCVNASANDSEPAVRETRMVMRRGDPEQARVAGDVNTKATLEEDIDVMEWYEDEPPEYTHDPFTRGMSMGVEPRSRQVVDFALEGGREPVS